MNEINYVLEWDNIFSITLKSIKYLKIKWDQAIAEDIS